MNKLTSRTSGTSPDDAFDEEAELALIELQQGQLVDKFGHKHSESILRNWTPRALKALGIRRIDDDGGAS